MLRYYSLGEGIIENDYMLCSCITRKKRSCKQYVEVFFVMSQKSYFCSALYQCLERNHYIVYPSATLSAALHQGKRYALLRNLM